jgi:hypothetical protein
MDQDDNSDIVLELSDIRYLLIPPDFNPFSKNEEEFMGESAIVRITRRLEPGWMRRRKKLHLTVKLPPDQIKPGLKEDVDAAVKRYCHAKIKDNKIRLANLYWVGLRAIPFSFLFLAVCLSLGRLLGGGVLTFIPDSLQSALSEGFTIIGWISLWDPVETLLFNPIRRENEILKYVMDMDIDIQAQSYNRQE